MHAGVTSSDVLSWFAGALTVTLWIGTAGFAFWRRRWMLTVGATLFAGLSATATLVYTGVITPGAGLALATRFLSLIGTACAVSSFWWRQARGRAETWTP